jgi:hypothetical protein
MRDWHLNPEWRAKFTWNTLQVFSGHPTAIGKDFELRCEKWDVQMSQWPDYRRYLRNEFKKAESEYEKSTRKSAEAQGLVRAPAKYSKANLEWFALYQFAGKSSSEIAAGSYGTTDESAVLKGIKAAAKLLAWENLR